MPNQYHRSTRRIFFFLVLFLFLSTLPAQADVGLPPAHPGWSISPGDFETNVQMISEEVLLDIKEPDQAQVEAVFNMQNQGLEDEAFSVWFPLGEEFYAGKEDRVFKVDDFRAWVGEDEVEVNIDGLDEAGLVWAHWPVVFPASEPIVLRVSYTLAPSLAHGVGWHQRFEYMLETGAGWLGVIESARVTIRSPYSLSEPNRLFDLGDPFFVRPLGFAAAGDEISWTFYALEPTAEHNIDFYLVYPSIWVSILEAHEDIESTGGSGESHWELAHGLYLWLTAFQSRQYAFRPSPPVSPDYVRVAPRIIESYVKAFELGVLDTSHFRSTIYTLRDMQSYAEIPELDGFFQTAQAQRPEDIELLELYEMAIDQGIADGIAPVDATEPPPTPTPLTVTSTLDTSPVPDATPFNSSTYLTLGLVSLLLAGVAFLLYYRSSRVNRSH